MELPVTVTAWGVALVAWIALEGVYLGLRRFSREPRWPWVYHLWALATAGSVGLWILGYQGRGWKASASLAVVLGAMVGFEIFDQLVIRRPWDAHGPPLMPKLARDVLRVLLLAAAGLVVATTILQQPLPAVLVSSTVLSAVVGLALQDVLKNVFAGMALELERPFQRGDWLLLDGDPVQVMETSWRSIKLLTAEGVYIHEPNSTFSGARLTNLGSGRRAVAFNFRVGLPYDAPPTRVRAALVRAAVAAPSAAASPPPEAFLESYGDSAIVYRLRVWTHAVDRLTRFRDQVSSRIWYELRRQGLSIPFPIRTVQLHAAERREQAARDELLTRARRRLEGVETFRSLSSQAQEQLARATRFAHYDDGEVLVRQGDTDHSLYVIDEGGVEVSAVSAEDPRAVPLASLGPGEFFGEMSLLTGSPRTATVTSRGGCEVLVLDKEALAPLLQEEPRLAEVLAAAVAARQARTRESLDERRQGRKVAAARDSTVQASLLGRIRSFFRLAEE